MADSSISGSNPNTGSRDNDRQLDELKSAHEKKMAQLRARQQSEESDVRASGDASVNHIRKSTEERIAQTRSDSEAKIEREGDSVSKTYGSLKKRAVEQTQANEKEIEASREHTDESISANKHRQDQAFAQSQDKLKDFLAKQRDLRAATERKSADEIRTEEKHNNEVLRQAKATNAREVRTLDVDNKERLHEVTEENKSTYEEAKGQAAFRLAQLRRDNDVKLKHEREQDNEAFLRVHQKAHDDVQKEQQLGQTRLSTVVEENQHKMEADRARSISTNEKLQREYTGETQRVEMDGKRDVSERTEKFNRVVIEQKEQQKAEIKNLAEGEEAKKEVVRAEGESQIKETVTKLGERLHTKTDQFNKQFAAEETANRSSLNNQKEVFLKEQYKQRRAQEGSVAIDDSRKGDDFYRPKSFDADLTEHEDSYVLKAKVPAHEKDNVEVRVKEGKVTISSARAFQDSIKDGDSRMETSSHQTYRQEIALPKPADAKRVITSIRDDGSITAIIPKKGFSRI
jgi:HSP20 family molecular chaperone IbpA